MEEDKLKADRSANIPVLSGSTMKLKPTKDLAMPTKTDPSRKGKKSKLPNPKVVHDIIRLSSFGIASQSASTEQLVEGRTIPQAEIDDVTMS